MRTDQRAPSHTVATEVLGPEGSKLKRMRACNGGMRAVRTELQPSHVFSHLRWPHAKVGSGALAQRRKCRRGSAVHSPEVPETGHSGQGGGGRLPRRLGTHHTLTKASSNIRASESGPPRNGSESVNGEQYRGHTHIEETRLAETAM